MCREWSVDVCRLLARVKSRRDGKEAGYIQSLGFKSQSPEFWRKNYQGLVSGNRVGTKKGGGGIKKREQESEK